MKKAFPSCLPNPPVGCIVVKNNQIVSQGYTNESMKYHAEAMALQELKANPIDCALFVTLEPCSFEGNTPSCAHEIKKSGIKEVYVGILDTDPRNNGNGINILKNNSIHVEVGVLQKQIYNYLYPYLYPNFK